LIPAANDGDEAAWGANAALRRASSRISERCKALLRLLAAPEDLTYKEVGSALEMPTGAVGPTRARCLDQPCRTLELAALRIG